MIPKHLSRSGVASIGAARTVGILISFILGAVLVMHLYAAQFQKIQANATLAQTSEAH